MIQKSFSRIMSLKDGKKKMSKSDPSDFSRINLNDTKDQIINKIRKAKTDSLSLPDNNKDLEKRPEAKNLIGIYSSLNDQDVNVTIEEFSGKNFSDLKNKLSELTVEKIYPISKEINKIKEDEKFIDQVLSEGSINANEISSKKINNMKKIIGF